MQPQYTHLPTDNSRNIRTPSTRDENWPDDVSEAGSSASGAPAASGNATVVSQPAVGHMIPRKPVPTAHVSTSHPSSPIVQPRQVQVFKDWWLEIGACILFVAAILAIVATLYPHQSKPLPQWPYSISINSLISIYVVVLKAAILLVIAEGISQLKWTWFKEGKPLEDLAYYDSASRGPLGALKLLWTLRTRHFLSSYFALITIIIVAIDPFAQQIIRYLDCGVPLEAVQATIPRTALYIGQGYHTGADDESVLPALQNAINAGIFSPGAAVSHECLTGNCTFREEYSTVGYCSICKDVTEELIFSNASYSQILDRENGNYTYTMYNLTTSLPSGYSVQYGTGSGFVNFTTIGVTQNNDVELIVGKGYPFDPATGDPPEDCDTASTNHTWRCQSYGASRCSLSPCVERIMQP